MIAIINESKTLTSIYDINVNLNLTVESVTHMKSGITIIVYATAKIEKKFVCSKSIIFKILFYVAVKIINV